MRLELVTRQQQQWLEGPAGEPLLRQLSDVIGLLEASAEHHTNSVLLHAENLTASFFDLKGGEAGEILQKCPNYGIQLAVIAEPGSAGTRADEMIREENRGRHFGVFSDLAQAEAWLLSLEQARKAQR